MEFEGRLVRDPVVGDEWIPIIPLVLRNADLAKPWRMLVDSGAHITLLPHRVGIALRVERGDDEPVTGEAIGGSNVSCLLRTIAIEIAGHTVIARIGWLFDDSTPPLLGRLDVFDAFHFDFRQSERRLIVTRRA